MHPHRLAPRLDVVLALVLTGKRNREIAAELHLGVHTVENYVSDILDEYECGSRTQLVIKLAGRGRA